MADHGAHNVGLIWRHAGACVVRHASAIRQLSCQSQPDQRHHHRERQREPRTRRIPHRFLVDPALIAVRNWITAGFRADQPSPTRPPAQALGPAADETMATHPFAPQGSFVFCVRDLWGISLGSPDQPASGLNAEEHDHFCVIPTKTKVLVLRECLGVLGVYGVLVPYVREKMHIGNGYVIYVHYLGRSEN